MDKSSKSSLMTSGTAKLVQNPNFMLYLVPSEIPTMWNIHVVLHVLKKDQALHKKNTKNSMKICQKLTVLSNCHNKTAFSNMSNGDISRTFFNMQGARCSSTKATLDEAKKTAVWPWYLISQYFHLVVQGGTTSYETLSYETWITNG